MNYYLKLLVISIIFSITDMFWVFINRNLYLNTIKQIQGSDIEIKSYITIFITYIIMVIGLTAICFQLVETNIQKYPTIDKNLIAFLSGALYGFVVNSIYNLTSYISYKNYTMNVAITDILWATSLYGLTSIIYINL